MSNSYSIVLMSPPIFLYYAKSEGICPPDFYSSTSSPISYSYNITLFRICIIIILIFVRNFVFSQIYSIIPTMKLQKLYSKVRQALDDYNMITENDKIAIGVSGGKDSLTLLYALSGIRSFYPVPFELVAIAVDLGYEDFDLSPVKALCDELSVEFYVVKTDIGRISLEKSKNQASPCSWCAKLRKGALNDFALSVGCNKIAYAHHMDDIIETMFLSLLYEGQFYSFAPVTQLDGSGLAIIRPLMYVGESDVKGFKNKYNLPVCKNPCPYDGHTRREYVKQLVRQLNMENPGVKKRLFSAIQNGNIDDWIKCTKPSDAS